jgi:hypothetical protein
MARPLIANLEGRIGEIPQHVTAVPPESATPIEHYTRSSNDAWNLLLYVDRNVKRANVYQTVADRHLARLRGMVLLSLIEAFERFVKELAAVCVDQIVPCVLDNVDRLAPLRVRPANVVAHFPSQDLGRALCEGDTWLDCDEINKRFRRLLATPFSDGTFYFFPKANKDLFAAVETLWQLRHTLAHNLGTITRSDAAKLRLLVKANVDAPRVLAPTGADVWYAKNLLDSTAESTNRRVAQEVASLLTTLHGTDPSLFAPQTRADDVARQFRLQATVAGAVGNP